MHEFSLAGEVITLIEKSARENKALRITHFHLEVGAASGVMIPALEFALDSLLPGSFLEGASRKITSPPAVFLCPQCNRRFYDLDLFSCCPDCGDYLTLVGGNEFKIKSIDIDQP